MKDTTHETLRQEWQRAETAAQDAAEPEQVRYWTEVAAERKARYEMAVRLAPKVAEQEQWAADFGAASARYFPRHPRKP